MTQQLPSILQPYTDLLENLAGMWLKTGASHVAVWGEGQVFANWSNKPTTISNSQPTFTQISAAIKVDGEIIGHLYVFGQNDRISKKRLKLDASLIAGRIKIDRIEAEKRDAPALTFADSQAAAEEVRSYQLQAEELQHQLHQVQKQFDALVQLNQYRYQETGATIDDWLTFFRKTVLDLIPSQLVFTLDDRGEEALILDSHPVRFKDAEDVVWYLQKIESIEQECLLDQALEPKEGVPESVRSLLYTPIYTGAGHAISVGLVNREDGPFSEGDQRLLQMIASQAEEQVDRLLSRVEALEENRLRTEMEVAFEVQNQLLPDQPPQVADLDIYAYSRPAMHVGGDFYDFYVRNDQSLIFTVGDVSGKGMSSALMMGSTRQILNSKARDELIETPSDLLASAVGDLYEDFMRVQMFATVFAGFYDPHTRQLIYANAGHSPVIYCTADGSARFLEADSPPLGVLNNSLAHNHKLQMRPGDCLMVATDGFSEAQNGEEQQLGNDRLLEVIRHAHQNGAADIAQALFKAIDGFALDTPQTDDQTLVIFKVE